MKRILAAMFLALLTNSAQARETPALAHVSQLMLEAREPERLGARITEITRELGGQLVSAGGGRVELELGSSKYPELRRRLGALGALRSEQVTAEDLTDEIAAAEARVEAARQSHERLKAANALARSVEDGLALERALEAAKKAIAEAEARVRALERQSERTRVVIRFRVEPVETVGKAALPFPWLAELGLPRLMDTTGGGPPPARELRTLIDAEAYVVGAHAADSDELAGTSNMLALGLTTRVLGEANPIGLFGGFDLTLGGGGGFWYGAQGLLGVGVPIGSAVAIGLSTGPGIDGITGGTIPFGVRLPIELYVSADIASFLAASLWAQEGWVFASDRREGGSEHAPFGDELSAGATLDFGTREDERSYTQNRFGPRIGFAYRELLDTVIYEIRIGWGAQEAGFSESY